MRSIHGNISCVSALVPELVSVCPIRFSQTGDVSETEGTVARLGGERTRISHEVPSLHGFVYSWLRILDQRLEYSWSTKVFLNLVWAALNKSQKMRKGKGTHIYWSWLWRRCSHFKDGEVEVRSPLKVTVVDYITESVICFLLVRGWYTSAHCYVARSVSLQESCYFPVPVVSGLAAWRTLPRGACERDGALHSFKGCCMVCLLLFSPPLQDQAKGVSSASKLGCKKHLVQSPRITRQLQWYVTWTRMNLCIS